VYDDAFTPAHDAREVIDKAGAAFYEAARRALDIHGTDFRAIAGDIKGALGIAGKALFQPLRAALTGELDGPEMARLLPLIGAERARKRLTM
jgi:glutamyl-tRNA synthetase